jgi:hypothetical protein
VRNNLRGEGVFLTPIQLTQLFLIAHKGHEYNKESQMLNQIVEELRVPFSSS